MNSTLLFSDESYLETSFRMIEVSSFGNLVNWAYFSELYTISQQNPNYIATFTSCMDLSIKFIIVILQFPTWRTPTISEIDRQAGLPGIKIEYTKAHHLVGVTCKTFLPSLTWMLTEQGDQHKM